MIKFWWDGSKQEVIYYVLKFANLLILSGIRKKCHSSGRNLLLYIFIKTVIKLTVVIIKDINVTNYIQNFIQYSCLKVNSIIR